MPWIYVTIISPPVIYIRQSSILLLCPGIPRTRAYIIYRAIIAKPNIPGFMFHAPEKSPFNKSIRARDIPHPGQGKPVIIENMQSLSNIRKRKAAPAIQIMAGLSNDFNLFMFLAPLLLFLKYL